MKYYFIVICLFLLPLHHLVGAAGLESIVDENGICADALAMGKAYSSFAEGLSGLYYNPGGIGLIQRKKVNLFYTKYFDSDAFFSFIGADLIIKKLGISLGLMNYSNSNIPIRDEYGNKRRQASINITNFRAGSSYPLKYDIYAGGFLEFQRNAFDLKTGSGFGLAVGALYKPLDRRISNLNNFIRNAATQLDAITGELSRELKEEIKAGNTGNIKGIALKILKIDPENKTAKSALREIFKDNGKFDAEEILKNVNPYEGLQYEIKNILSDKEHSARGITDLYNRGFDYFNRGELYAAVQCWNGARQIILRNKWRNRFSAGFYMKNIFGPNIKMVSAADNYPPRLQFGAGYYILPEKLRLGVDISLISSVQKNIHIGGEYLPIKHLAVRFGIQNSMISLGFGLKYKTIEMNYAYRPFELGGYHMIDMNYYFGKTKFERAFTFLQLGRLNLEDGDYFGAKKNFRRCLAIDPSFTIANKYLIESEKHIKEAKAKEQQLLQRARDKAGTKDFSKAVELLQKALRLNPDDGDAALLLEKMKSQKDYFEKEINSKVENALRTNNFTEAERFLLDLVKQQPGNNELKEKLSLLRARKEKVVSGILKRGDKEFKKNKFYNAKQIYEEAVKIDPSNPEVKEKYESSLDKIDELNRQQRVEQIYRDFLKNAAADFAAGRISDAIIKYNRAIDIHPKSKEARAGLSKAVGKYVAEVDKPYQEGLRALKKNDFRTALDKFGVVLAVDPKHPVALKKIVETKNKFAKFLEDNYNAAISALNKDKYKQAIDIFNMILKYKPQYKDTLVQLQKATRGWEEYKKKAQEMKLMKAAEPKFQRGIRYFNDGRLTDAILQFNEAVKIYNKHYKAYFNMGLCYEMLNQPEMAMKAYEKAINSNPDFAKAYHNLGILYLMFGQRDKALTTLKKASELDPNYKKTKELIKKIKQNE